MVEGGVDPVDEVEVRRMTRADVEGAVGVHLAAFRGSMNCELGRGYVRRFLSWFVASPDAIALVGATGDQVLGYSVGAPVGYQRRLNRDLGWVVVGALAVRPWLLVRSDILSTLASRLRAALRQPAERAVRWAGPTMSLVGIGVLPRARGLGLGAMLMAAFEGAARSRGMGSLRLSVYRDNEPARRLYEGAGWLLERPEGGHAVSYWKELDRRYGG